MNILERKQRGKIWNSLLVFLGFWLSPLSPWNDFFTNIPIAYGFGLLFSAGNEALFFPAVIIGYWLSNIAGFVLMHFGYVGLKEKRYSFRDHWKRYMLATTLYTVVVGALVWFEILPSVQDIVSFLN